jgi:hypothetical protein
MTRDNAADILCIGAQRSMTSWLHNVLASHPGSWVFPNFEPLTSTTKEAHFWDWNHRRGPDWYRVLMRPLADGLKSLDFTPDYAGLTDEQISECKALNPSARIVYILRDPLARAVSAIRMHTMWATKNAAPADHRIVYDRHFHARCHHANLWMHGDYAGNVARWRRHFPEMLVLSYEEVSADPKGQAARIAEACGLSMDGLDDTTRAAFDTRAGRRVWEAPRYALDDDCLHFLHGALWLQRERTQAELGITFHECETLLEGAA